MNLFVSAGEASGDLHGSFLVRAIKARSPEARITCLGGPLLREAGAKVLVDNRDIAVVGLFEVLRHAKVIHRAWKKIRDHLVRERPDVVVLIDFPDFNALLARLSKRLGLKVFYYISPQVWAWRSGRVRTLRRLVDRMAVILPFEPSFYRRYGMEVHHVGHPLLDVLREAPSREEAVERYRHGTGGPVVGLLPGSRHSEIRSLLPILLETAKLLKQALSDISFIIPVASTLDPGELESQVSPHGLPVRLVAGDTYGVIRACDLVVTASGTVTLETAILGTPMIIVYRVSDLSYTVGHRLIKVNLVGLPNLIAGRVIVPELLQKDARPDRIATEALALLKQPERLERQRQELAAIRNRLGEPGVADRVAAMVLEVGERQGARGNQSA